MEKASDWWEELPEEFSTDIEVIVENETKSYTVQ